MINVLYVDDETINLELFGISFKKEFSVFKAHSGVEALKILESHSIDVIVTDFKMPGMNGYELINEVKHKFPQKKCILLTGYLETAMEEHSKSGELVFHYMRKPFVKEELKQIIVSAANHKN